MSAAQNIIRKPRILLLGCYYSSNLGDGVICECVASQIQRTFPGASITIADLWNRTSFEERSKFEKDSEASQCWRAYMWLRSHVSKILTKTGLRDRQEKKEHEMLCKNKEVFERIFADEYDLVVYAGGQMFMDAYVLENHHIVKHFAKAGTPVIFNACGVGPAYSKKLRNILSQMLEQPNVVAISSRDGAAQMNRNCTTQKKRTEETFDPALICSEVYQMVPDGKSETLGLGIMWASRISPHAACRFWHKLILTLEKRKIPWKIFVNGAQSDTEFARYVIETLPGFNRSFDECFVPAPTNPKELVQTIGQFKSIISFRLHSHIIATSLDVPSVAVVWDNKVRLFFEKLGHPERCCTMSDSPDTVLQKLEMAQRQGYDRALVEKQKQYSEQWLIDAISSTGLK